MTKDELVQHLAILNPRVAIDRLIICADALTDYRTAQENIDEHGTIVSHPRTGAPIVNPYIPIRTMAVKRLMQLNVKTGELITGVAPKSQSPDRKTRNRPMESDQ